MTWTWQIDGLGTDEQTLTVYDPDGNFVESETREGWSWPTGEWPEYVGDIVGNKDFQALYMGNIERRSDQ